MLTTNMYGKHVSYSQTFARAVKHLQETNLYRTGQYWEIYIK